MPKATGYLLLIGLYFLQHCQVHWNEDTQWLRCQYWTDLVGQRSM